MRLHPKIAASLLVCIAATGPTLSAAFVPRGGRFATRPAVGTGSSLGMVSESEPFHRSLLQARLEYEGKSNPDADDATQIVQEAAAAPSSAPSETFQRALLADRLGREATAKVAGAAAAAADGAARAVRDAEQAEIDRIAAEKAAKDAKQKETDRMAAEKLAEEAERSAAADGEEAKKLEEEKEKAAEEARIAAAEKAAEAEKIAAERAAAAAERTAQAAKRAAEEREAAAAAAEKELADLSSRTAELKARAKSVAERVPYLSGSRPLLPSGNDVSSALAKVRTFNPREAADQAKLRKESNSELLRATASGLARAAVDGFGTGVEIVDAVREDDELRSVVSEAFGTARAATSALFRSSPTDDGDDASATLQRKAKTAYIALDSVGIAAYASICGVLGYGSAGGPVAESASRAAEGFVNAIGAAAALGLRSTDTVVQAAEKASKEAQDVVEERKVAEEVRSGSETAKAAEVAAAKEETVASSKEEEAEEVETIDISIPYDAAAKLSYEASDKSMAYADFKTNFEADAVTDVVAKQPVDVSIPYDAAAKNAYEASDKSTAYADFKIKYEADAVSDVTAKKKASAAPAEKAVPKEPAPAKKDVEAVTQDPREAFQRSLLEARLQLEKSSN